MTLRKFSDGTFKLLFAVHGNAHKRPCKSDRPAFSSLRCGCEFSQFGSPCVAQRVCAMPQCVSKTVLMTSCLLPANGHQIGQLSSLTVDVRLERLHLAALLQQQNAAHL